MLFAAALSDIRRKPPAKYFAGGFLRLRPYAGARIVRHLPVRLFSAVNPIAWLCLWAIVGKKRKCVRKRVLSYIFMIFLTKRDKTYIMTVSQKNMTIKRD